MNITTQEYRFVLQSLFTQKFQKSDTRLSVPGLAQEEIVEVQKLDPRSYQNEVSLLLFGLQELRMKPNPLFEAKDINIGIEVGPHIQQNYKKY